jgi:hypothetical protein
MLHQVKPAAQKTGTTRGNLYDRKVPVIPNGIVTLHLASGAPGVTYPVQVTHEQMHNLRCQGGQRWTRADVAMLMAYAKLYPPAK